MASRQGIRNEVSHSWDTIAVNDDPATKYLSRWDFAFKEGATTIRADSAACKVSTSSLKIEK